MFKSIKQFNGVYTTIHPVIITIYTTFGEIYNEHIITIYLRYQYRVYMCAYESGALNQVVQNESTKK